jgi:hypothetical protein
MPLLPMRLRTSPKRLTQTRWRLTRRPMLRNWLTRTLRQLTHKQTLLRPLMLPLWLLMQLLTLRKMPPPTRHRHLLP